MSAKIFEYIRTNGDILSEHFSNGSFTFKVTKGSVEKELLAYSLNIELAKKNELYLGHTLEEVIDSPIDILGNEFTKNGCPSYGSLRGVLPEITEDAYCFLSGAASHGGVTVDRFGVVTPQESGRERVPAPLFKPCDTDESLSDVTPEQYFLDGRYPILFNVFKSDEKITELMYFVDSGDSDRDPIVWIRKKTFSPDAPEAFSITYGAREISHGYCTKSADIFEVGADLFNDTLAHTLAYWMSFTEKGVRLSLPIEELVKVTEGAMISARTTFTGPRPHYGHKYYGKELHDNFPPNYIWAIEASILTGHAKWAKEIFEHLINYGLTDEGKFCYRQGALISGASATEYGMVLWLVNRYKKVLLDNEPDTETVEKLRGMGNIIISHLIPCSEFDGLRLIKMCAEADNNVRVNVYLNNNLWSIRGLEALYEICGDQNYKNSADIIRQNINIMLDKYSVKDSEFGDVPPFRFGYPAIPYTLSNCKTHLLPESEEAREKYFYTVKGRRDFDVTDQEITENTYANYRYYPESLSAMLLPENYANGILKMRDNLGGNLLEMVRFRSWIDNWPVVNYARFLLETERVDKYLLLLYAHTQHHGHPNLMCYYEQIKLFGKVSANDCVPSLLTTPIMTTWMLAYETMNGKTLRLLSAVPHEWLEKDFVAEKVGTSNGYVNINYKPNRIEINFSEKTSSETEIYLNNRDRISPENVKADVDIISRIESNKIILKSGITEAALVINK